jgi:sugar O-acyltransferase (sialic acid O-acetyltransferase NeuD family)
MSDFLLYAAGGHARVLASGLLASGHSVLGIFDDDPTKLPFYGIPFLGSYNSKIHPESLVLLSMGSIKSRQQAQRKVAHAFGTWQHPNSIVASDVTLGEGTVVMAAAVIQAASQIGKHVIINTGACIDHECVLGDFVHISPNATLCGNISIGKGSQIGAGAVILPNLQIGEGSVIGAGSVIVDNVPDGVVYVGNPGKFLKLVS